MKRISLVGNPNSGKSSLYNHLTGLSQKIGNYPGITIDKKSGNLLGNTDYEVVDLPGVYNLLADSNEEIVTVKELINLNRETDVMIYVVNPLHLKRTLILFTQVADLQLPSLMVLNYSDLVDESKIQTLKIALEKWSGIPVFVSNSKDKEGIEEIKKGIEEHQARIPHGFCLNEFFRPLESQGTTSPALHNFYGNWLAEENKIPYKNVALPSSIKNREKEADLTLRLGIVDPFIKQKLPQNLKKPSKVTERIDNIALHPVWGNLVFLGILYFIFQAIFTWSSIPMDFIDSTFGSLANWTKEVLPAGMLTDLISEGIIAGIGGVVIFIPQIALLFLFLTILERTGYMSRVVFLMDNLMRKFGLNGRSVVPLMSGIACSIPAIMAARTISNQKERLLTILVTPFMPCAARLPIYTILIALVVPTTQVWGIFNLQALALLALYLLGIGAAFAGAFVLKFMVKSQESSFLMLEMPAYSLPSFKDLGLVIWEKVKVFIFEAGKIIFFISIGLWLLASFGPNEHFSNAEQLVKENSTTLSFSEEELEDAVAAYQLEHSYIGYLGKAFEPIFRPLGYDWKINIGLISSFAAREVFVGTMAVLYSAGSQADDEQTIKSRMAAEISPQTGKPVYSIAVAFSLLVFYALAMQCMSTFAIVKRETKSWSFAIGQFVIMSLLAYVSAFITYQLLV